MKSLNAVLTLAVIALAATVSSSAFAWHGGHARFGVYIGAPGYWYPPYYYPPYAPPYAYPPVVVAPPAPQVYIEQGSVAPAATASQAPAQSQSTSPSNWWYYCADAKAYYPYVKECPAGWQKVAPQPQQ